jgi:hypothetical protein
MAQLAGRASAEVHSKKVLREAPRTCEGSVLGLLGDGRARVMVRTKFFFFFFCSEDKKRYHRWALRCS